MRRALVVVAMLAGRALADVPPTTNSTVPWERPFPIWKAYVIAFCAHPPVHV